MNVIFVSIMGIILLSIGKVCRISIAVYSRSQRSYARSRNGYKRPPPVCDAHPFRILLLIRECSLLTSLVRLGVRKCARFPRKFKSWRGTVDRVTEDRHTIEYQASLT